MSFLILRSRAVDTLVLASTLREDAALLGIDDPVRDIRCPSCRVVRRVGRSRHREEQDTPILGSFIFVRWNGQTRFANWLEDQYYQLGVMRLPQGGFAECSEAEVDAIGQLVPLPPILPDVPLLGEDVPVFQIDQEVVVQTIGFLNGITGKVLRTKSDGQVVLKIIDNKGWKLSTLLIHWSALQVATLPPVEVALAGPSV